MDDDRSRLERKLSPSATRLTLLRAATLLVGWELIQPEVVDKTRDFFSFGFNPDGPVVSQEYTDRVTSRAPRIFDASVEWLIEAGALTSEQADRLKDLRDYRNLVAHELPRFMVDVEADIDLSKLVAMRDVVASLGRFWGQIEVDTNPDFDGRDVDPAAIVSGPMALFEFALELSIE